MAVGDFTLRSSSHHCPSVVDITMTHAPTYHDLFEFLTSSLISVFECTHFFRQPATNHQQGFTRHFIDFMALWLFRVPPGLLSFKQGRRNIWTQGSIVKQLPHGISWQIVYRMRTVELFSFVYVPSLVIIIIISLTFSAHFRSF